jgi:TRAP-type C4-dicarboxylate transport system substrate-binding protein
MKSWTLRALIVCVFVMGLCCFSLPAFGQEKSISLNYSIHFPAPHTVTGLAKEWAKEIEKRTDGRVKVTVFPGGTLLAADKCYDGVVKGIADIGFAVPALTRGRFPLTEVIDLPLGYRSATGATRLINEFYNKFKPKEFDDVQIMYFQAHGPAILHSKKAVNKLEDFKGLKVRCTGLAAKIVAALGGAPVAMPVGEAYDALSRGVVDASLGSMEALEGWRWGEVAKFSTEGYGFANTTGFFVFMNKKKWNALPPDAQKIIGKINEEWIEKEGKNWDRIDKSGREFGLKLGNKIITLSQEENERVAKAVRPLFDEYVKKMKGNGLPGEEVLAFCLDRLQKLQ